jgi:hypothetical protein
MANPRAGAIAAIFVGAAVLFSGCLSGPTPVPKVQVTLLTDHDLVATPGWTVGFAFEVFESVGDNVTVLLSATAGDWQTRLLNSSFTFAKANGRHTTFLLVDIPADAGNGTVPVKISAALGGDSAQATGTIRVSRPTANLVKNDSVVGMDYIGFLEDNRVFDTSIFVVANSSGLDKWPDFANSSALRHDADYHTFTFTEGKQQVIKGWETGIAGMSLGGAKALIIPAEEAYARFVNQTLNLTQPVPIYNDTTIAAFTPVFGSAPQEDNQYVDPTYGWTIRVVSVDNATGRCVYENLPMENATYTPYGVNATVTNISSVLGTLEIHYTVALHQSARYIQDTGEVIELNATSFTVRWQTEHRQTLAPYALYFLVYVRTVTG